MDHPHSYTRESNILLESMAQSILITGPELESPGPYKRWGEVQVKGKTKKIVVYQVI